MFYNNILEIYLTLVLMLTSCKCYKDFLYFFSKTNINTRKKRTQTHFLVGI